MSGKKYVDIVFIQNRDEYDDIPTIGDDFPDWDAVVDYLSQWDQGDSNERDELGAGSADTIIRLGDYVLTVNRPLGYVGLMREIEGTK